MARKWLDSNYSIEAMLVDVRTPTDHYPPGHFFYPDSQGDHESQASSGGDSSDDSDDDTSSQASSSSSSNDPSSSSDSDSDDSSSICTPHSSQGLFNKTPSSARSPFANISLNLNLNDTDILQFIIVQFFNLTDQDTQGTYCWFIASYVLLMHCAKLSNLPPLMDVMDNPGDRTFHQIFMDLLKDCGPDPKRPLPLLKVIFYQMSKSLWWTWTQSKLNLTFTETCGWSQCCCRWAQDTCPQCPK